MMSDLATPAIARRESFLFVMNRYETLNLETETSLLLMQELLTRGHPVCWVQGEDVALDHNRPCGLVSAVNSVAPFRLAPQQLRFLDESDALVLRKDPPFDTSYLQLTLILDFLEARVTQFNDARALRNFNEKLMPLLWPAFAPPTLVSGNAAQLGAFVDSHREVVLKPLHDCSGRGVRKIDRDPHGNYRTEIARALAAADGQYLIAQKYLAGVGNGDKRVYLVDGEPVGAVNRLPRPGTFLANIHQGAACVPTALSARERHIIESIAPTLRRQGIFLAGADFIDGYLTELNITSPSAVRQINAVSDARVERRIVDAMLQHLRRVAVNLPAPADFAMTAPAPSEAGNVAWQAGA